MNSRRYLDVEQRKTAGRWELVVYVELAFQRDGPALGARSEPDDGADVDLYFLGAVFKTFLPTHFGIQIRYTST